jgi:chromosome segregation ATPase
MSSGYESLKDMVQKTLQHSPMAVARGKGRSASSLSDEINGLQQMLIDRLAGLKAAVKEDEALVASENHHVEQVIVSLRTDIAAQQAQLNAVREKELARQKIEQTLNAKISDLENDLKKKEKTLESRGKEVNDLKAKIDVLGGQITRLETAIQQAKAEANGAAAKITRLEGQLKDKDEMVRAKELTFKELERNFTAKIQNLESQIKNKEKLFTEQDKQVNDLNCQLETLRNGIKGVSSFFRQAESLTAVEAQGPSRVAPGEQSNAREANPATSQSTAPAVTSNAADASQELVPASFFDEVIHNLAEILGPFSSLIVRDHVRALGESIEKFPKTRVTELAKNLSEEIANEKLKIGFLERLAVIGETVSASSTKSNSYHK